MSVLTPLSNDPESLTDYTKTLGVEESSFVYAEVFSLDPDMLAILPPDPKALIFLFPVGEKDGPLEKRHQDDKPIEGKTPFFIKQYVSNACGTIAVIHSIANNVDSFKIKEGSWLDKYIKSMKDKTPKERGDELQKDDSIQEVHETAATEDDTPMLEKFDNFHFIAFVPFEGKVWELDGRKPEPICHGEFEDFFTKVRDVITTQFYPHLKDIMESSMVTICKA